MKHLLKLSDLSEADFSEILDLADKLKYERKNGIPHKLLQDKTLGMIFRKSRVSMGGAVIIDEYSRDVTDVNIVRETINRL